MSNVSPALNKQFVQATALYCGTKVYVIEVTTTSYGTTRCCIIYDGLMWVDLEDLNQVVWLPELPELDKVMEGYYS